MGREATKSNTDSTNKKYNTGKRHRTQGGWMGEGGWVDRVVRIGIMIK